MSPATVRPGTVEDAIDGVVPSRVAQPQTPRDLAHLLAQASRDHHVTVIRGGGTKLGWGRVPTQVDLLVGTGRLDQLIAHRHGDMTATVQAGMPLNALNDRLSEYGQCLPVESAFDGTTVGGLVATNEAGPLRHRFGTPRDLLIGVTLALTDGRIVKAGGTVVKNVAGYDLGKLVSGSYGSLAAIVDATFKLVPIPPASATLVATYQDIDRLVRDAATLGASQVELTAFDVRVSELAGFQLLMRMASSPTATEALSSAAAQVLSTAPTKLSGERERALWAEQVQIPWSSDGTTVRLSWLPARLSSVLALVQQLPRHGCRVGVFTGRCTGAGLLRLEGDVQACARAIADLRANTNVGHVVVLRATRALKGDVDVWGPPTGAAEVAHALKRMFDPAGILNAGRGPV